MHGGAKDCEGSEGGKLIVQRGAGRQPLSIDGNSAGGKRLLPLVMN
jgi:hypothetical protein